MSKLFKHYENFPKAIFLLPKNKRKAILNLYEFARTADDIADEDRIEFSNRIKKLETLRKKLINPDEDLFFRIHNDSKEFNIDISLYDDL
ncbi:MAG: squalene/phytoene synthase family protein, partial [bacterium]|nr:squalene/phytoene synthase family protein [bacterium]